MKLWLAALALSLPLAALADERQPVLDLSLSPEVGVRKFTWRDRVTPSLASYSSGTMVLGRAALEVFPFANAGLPVMSHVGLLGSVSRSLRTHTPDVSGAEYTALWHGYSLGAEWRAIFGDRFYGALSLRYESLRFDLSGPSGPGVLLPGGLKQAWRPGVLLRLPLGPIAIAADGGYLAVVVHDAVSRAFPRSTVAGVEGGLHLEWALTRLLALQLSGTYTRFFYSLHPLAGDDYVAGGALDEFAVVDLALHARF